MKGWCIMSPMCELWKNFNDNSRTLAKAKEMDVKNLATVSGMSRQSIYSYWSGRMMPGLERIEMIARALEVDPLILLSNPDTVDFNDIIAGGTGRRKPAPVPPEDLLDDQSREALALGRRVMQLEDHDLLLRACEHAPAGRIRRIAALLID